MPVDSSIYFQQQQVQPPDQLNKLAQFGQIQNAQSQNRLAQLQFDTAQRGFDQEAKLNDLYKGAGALNPDGTLNRQAILSGAATAGLGSRIPGLQKQFADADKAQADVDESRAKAKKTGFEAANLALVQGRDMLNNVTDPAAGRQWLIAQYQNPDTAKIFNNLGPLDVALQRYDQQTATPDGFAKWRQGASTNAEQLVKLTTPDANTRLTSDTSRQNNADTNATSRANNASTNATTQRGQNLTDSRAREANNKGQYDATNGILVDTRTGQARPVIGPDGQPMQPAGKAPTEFQGKNAVFGSRAQEADKILTGLTGNYNVGAVNLKSGTNGMAGTALNYALSPNSQRAEQAQRDFINAVLRQESGAAIAESEFDNARKQYFPQPGDSKEVIGQKASNRQLVIQGFKDNSGPLAKKSFGNSGSAPQQSPGVPADIGDLLNKYGG